MRISDWSSDVCSSDLLVAALVGRDGDTVLVSEEVGLGVHPSSELGRRFRDQLGTVNVAVAEAADEVLLVDRKSVVLGKSVSVRVDLGGRRNIKKKKYIIRSSHAHTKKYTKSKN